LEDVVGAEICINKSQ